MKISELLKKLSKVEATHGDIDFCWGFTDTSDYADPGCPRTGEPVQEDEISVGWLDPKSKKLYPETRMHCVPVLAIE